MRKKAAAGVISDTGRKARFETWDAPGPVNAASMPSVAEGSRLSPVANPTTDCRRATTASVPSARRWSRDPGPSRPGAPAGAVAPAAREIPATVRRWPSA